MMHTITLKDCTDTHSELPAARFLQTRFWAEFKKQHGWKYRQYEVHVADSHSFLLTVLVRPLPLFGLLAYIPMGPSLLTDCDSLSALCAQKRGLFLSSLAEKLVPLLPGNVFLIRFDPPWECAVKNTKNEYTEERFPLCPYTKEKGAYRLLKAQTDIQPPDTVQLDLSRTLETLLTECKPKWRYNIRLAEKKGVKVQCFAGSKAEHGIQFFYPLYCETAVRDGIAIHSEAYYRSLCQLATHPQYVAEKISISVYGAFFEEKPLAAIITLFTPYEAVYLYGASSNEHRNLMPAYLLQWHAIQDAKTYGCNLYDFYGIPPCNTPDHPMYGLYRFKTGFGGTIIHRVGTIDVPVHRGLYSLYVLAEQLRTFWFKTVKKKLRGLFS